MSYRGTRINRNNRRYYTDGSVAVAPVPRYAPTEQPRELSHAARRNREKAKHMSPGYVIFLVFAVSLVAVACAQYIKLQSEVTILSRTTAKLEGELMDVTLSNDEEYARIMGAVDIEKIKQTAMEDLGMTYPDESQVVNFANADSDYVRQFSNIPN